MAPRQHDRGADWLNVQRNGDAIAAAVWSLSIFAHKKGRPRWPPEMKPVSQYQHNRTGEDNADAHLKRQVMSREVVVAISKGKLDLDPWEQIFYGEFDGHRRKRVLVKISGKDGYGCWRLTR